MPALTIMIKPASSNCNMRCDYCFYTDESNIRSQFSFGFMTSSTLETIVQKALLHSELHCTFAFQGGEPTLVGLSFFKKLLFYEKKHNHKNIPIQNIIQTNGYVIDDIWAHFLAKNDFLVGLSVDGPQATHDTHRKTPDKQNTFSRISHTISLLTKHRVKFNVLTVVTKTLASSPRTVYQFYKYNNLLFQQYIPCLPPLGAKTGSAYSPDAKAYGNFLISLFDLWYNDIMAGNLIYISFFEDLLGILKHKPASSCSLCSECQKQYVIEADGGVYPCDFYALDNYRIGNILHDSFFTLDHNRESIKFIEQSRLVPFGCTFCKWHFICNSGCRRERDTKGTDLSANMFCLSYKLFFDYSFERLYELSRLL